MPPEQKRMFQVLVSTGNGMVTFVHCQVTVESGIDLMELWQQQRMANQAYFSFPKGKILMHNVIGVIE